MAARRLLSRCASLWRAKLVSKPLLVRQQSIFTKVREPPNGFLFNEKPRKPGEKRPWEEWEAIWYRWWIIMFVLGGVLFYYKPDTRPQTWARQEALRQIAEEESEELEE
ncbi:uncharacterized protein LOC110242119 [Exaiptasia diaphana]|uniref:NADH dehydrogenase [ubiquinone] 1 beta subcomplex subunit 11, mitochondrial n=1 Tax=Exaiptasia diaphana TaxID=2652724 RepID=A0A913XFR2_EXADI|nr:uncharacterized protein LOC110242119 [Exaiptasia diaphana]KXJ12512.1 hypothetical protein AC249_AIPGENE22257 [Exaiptasia diaphana]